MIRLLLASELLGPILCSHIDWDCTHSNWILECSVVDVTLRLFILGFEGSLTEKEKKTGWVGRGEEQRRHFSPGSKAPAAAVATAAACLPVLQGGFLACQAWEASHTDGLETRVYPLLLLRTRVSSTGAVRQSYRQINEEDYFFSFSHICDSNQQKGGLLHL